MNNFIKLLLSPALFINRKVKNTNWYKNINLSINNYPTNDWYRQHLERNFDVINLGSSSALYAFNYSDLDVKSFNWALQPQSMEYSFKILKKYFSILKKHGVVLIPFSPFSALSVEGKWSSYLNDRYYNILDIEDIDDYENVFKRRNYPLFTNTKAAIKSLIKDQKTFNRLSRYNNEIDFEKDAENWINGWKKEFLIDDLNDNISNINLIGFNKRKVLVDEMIRFCRERDLIPVIVIPPLHRSLYNKLTPTFRKKYIYDFIHELDSKNVLILDYMSDKLFYDDINFYNSFFLSEIGSRLFTDKVLKDCGVIKLH